MAYYSSFPDALPVDDSVSISDFETFYMNIDILTYRLRDDCFKRKIIHALADLFYDDTFFEKLNSNPRLLCFNDGVYDLNSLSFRNGEPTDYITYSTGYIFLLNPDTDKLNFIQKILTDIFPESEIKIYVLRLFASFLHGFNKDENFHIFFGHGKGKSTLLQLFALSLGDYACKFPDQIFFSKQDKPNVINTFLYKALNRRFLYSYQSCCNPQDNDLNSSVVNVFTGGDKVICRTLYMDSVEKIPQFKIILACDDKPSISQYAISIWRRITCVQFNSSFVDSPKELNELKIIRDLSQSFDSLKDHFMFLLLDSYKSYLNIGLSVPDTIKTLNFMYQLESKHVHSYFIENIQKKKGHVLKINDVYRDFLQWYHFNFPSDIACDIKHFKEVFSSIIKQQYNYGWFDYRIKLDDSELSFDELFDKYFDIDHQKKGNKYVHSLPIDTVIPLFINCKKKNQSNFEKKDISTELAKKGISISKYHDFYLGIKHKVIKFIL